jgi:DNA-directed RNA polymerase
MTWLGQCAHTVAGQAPKGNEAPVTWTTPLGLPVVQPYMKRSRRVVQTILQVGVTTLDLLCQNGVLGRCAKLGSERA